MTFPATKMLATPLRFRTFEAPNRIGLSPHSTMFAKNGRITEKHLKYYGLRAEKQVGMLFIGGLRVSPSALGADCQISVADEDAVTGLTALAKEVHAKGSKIIGQLLHPGLQRSGGDVDLATVAPSSVVSPATQHQPHVLTTEEIGSLIDEYAQAAKRCADAGFDGVEIHAAHGYLGHSFLSPVDNHRTDEYGQDRALFLQHVIQACKKATSGEISVGARISINDFASSDNRSLSVEEMVRIAERLADKGLDFLDCSFDSALSAIPDMEFTPFAMEKIVAKFRNALPSHVPVLAVGRILTPESAEEALVAGSCDAVLMARSLIADPEWAEKALAGRGSTIRPCIGCNQGCAGRIHISREMRCLTNPEVGHEADWGTLAKTQIEHQNAKRVWVIGGGPAGLEAARVAATLGAKVTLFEAQENLGGLASVAAEQKSRSEFRGAYEWRIRELERLNVKIHTNHKVTINELRGGSFDALIIATGVKDELSTENSEQITKLPLEQVDKVVWEDFDFVCIVDRAGDIGALSTAIDAASAGVEAAVITHTELPAALVPKASRYGRLRQAAKHGVKFYRSSVFMSISRGELHLQSSLDKEAITTVPGFAGKGLILETGTALGEEQSAASTFEEWSASSSIPSAVIGDAYSRRDALHAIREGYIAARRIMGVPVPEVLSF